ncbi:MAG TPA: HAD-IC family P-type ATPase, partial [Chitinophagaceae bacterium]
EVTNILFVGTGEEILLKRILLSIEMQSEHPLAEAVVRNLQEEKIQPVTLHKIESLTGKGVKAHYEGKQYLIGNTRLLSDYEIKIEGSVKDTILKWQEKSKTVILFAENSQLIGIIAIADKIKTSSPNAVKHLLDKGIEVYMLTGDNKQTASAIASQVGITQFKAEVMPSDKAAFIQVLQRQGKVVAMVGDGINDSHALAQADVSIAMGKGSDIAMDVAKMTLITSDLNSIPRALTLSSKTVITIKQNLFWAFIYNVIGIPLAAGILYPINGFLLDPMIAGAAMALSSVSVVGNSLRLKFTKLN